MAHLSRREAPLHAAPTSGPRCGCNSIVANKPGGAFYFTVMFNDGVLNDRQSLSIENCAVRQRVEEMVGGVAPDKRFVYYLTGATGTSSPSPAFRQAPRIPHHLLESDDAKRAGSCARCAVDRYHVR